jgi:hypothetical protein
MLVNGMLFEQLPLSSLSSSLNSTPKESSPQVSSNSSNKRSCRTLPSLENGFENNDVHIDISKSGSTLPNYTKSRQTHSIGGTVTSSNHSTKADTTKFKLLCSE